MPLSSMGLGDAIASGARPSTLGAAAPFGTRGIRPLGRLHVVVDAEEVAAAALTGGAPTIQVRLKTGTDRDRLAVIERIVARCAEFRAQCLVNDRVDLALAAGADGVHVGADDLPVLSVRRLLSVEARDDLAARSPAGVRPHFVVGGTARDPSAARRLVDEGASYLGVGPVFATTSKDGLPDPIGLDGLAAVVAAVEVPVIAIAGITAERVAAVLDTGAWGVAVIGAVCAAPDPAAATAELLTAIATHPPATAAQP